MQREEIRYGNGTRGRRVVVLLRKQANDVNNFYVAIGNEAYLQQHRKEEIAEKVRTLADGVRAEAESAESRRRAELEKLKAAKSEK